MEPQNTIPLFSAVLSENELETGIFALSFVDNPAVEKHFVALEKAGKPHPIRMSIDKMKKIVTGPVLIPNKLILRDEIPECNLPKHYIQFSREEIARIAQRLMKTGVALHSTSHQHETPLANNYLVELWIIENPALDKAAALGYTDLPAGTLMASVQIADDVYWNEQVLSGKVRGFSLEGFFLYNKLNMFKPKKTAAKAAQDLKPKNGVTLSLKVNGHTVKLESETSAEAEEMAAVVEDDETGSGTVVTIFELSEGGEIHIMSDGSAKRDGENVPAGNYPLTDGATLVIDADGNFSLTTDDPDTAAQAAEAEVALKAARESGKAMIAQLHAVAGKKPAAPAKQTVNNAVATELAALRAKVAKLEATPSGEPATPGVVKTATHTWEGRVAASLMKARERQGKN